MELTAYNYNCDFCEGKVEEKILPSEIFPKAFLDKKRKGYVILEIVPVGVCNKCGHKYYSDEVLDRAEEIMNDEEKAEKLITVPVGKY